MTTLKNADLVRLASWTNSFAKVGTLAGHYGRPVSLREIAKEEVICGSEVWTVYTGATLSSDKGFYDRERALYETAIVIAPGDIVEIDGNVEHGAEGYQLGHADLVPDINWVNPPESCS